MCLNIRNLNSTDPITDDNIIADTEPSIKEQISIVGRLSETASEYPYYKYNSLWTRDIQNTVSSSKFLAAKLMTIPQIFYILFSGWLGASLGQGQGHQGRLLALEEVGQILKVPVNLKEEDSFHLTIEEYLHALINLIDELARLAINAVIQGDYEISLQVSTFVKDIHAGFQILNLKNDSLRRRSDSIKYSVKKVEDVVYDLSLRNLLPKNGGMKD